MNLPDNDSTFILPTSWIKNKRTKRLKGKKKKKFCEKRKSKRKCRNDKENIYNWIKCNKIEKRRWTRISDEFLYSKKKKKNESNLADKVDEKRKKKNTQKLRWRRKFQFSKRELSSPYYKFHQFLERGGKKKKNLWKILDSQAEGKTRNRRSRAASSCAVRSSVGRSRPSKQAGKQVSKQASSQPGRQSVTTRLGPSVDAWVSGRYLARGSQRIARVFPPGLPPAEPGNPGSRNNPA